MPVPDRVRDDGSGIQKSYITDKILDSPVKPGNDEHKYIILIISNY